MVEACASPCGGPFRSRPRTYQGTQSKTLTVGWDKLGTRVATGGADASGGTAIIWRTTETHCQRESTLKGHKQGVEHLCWDPNNANMLCTVSGDASVRLWDVRSRAAVHNLTISGKNRNVAWRPDSSAMAVSNDKDVISFIDVKTFKVVDKLNRGKAVNEMTWDKTGEMFLVTTGTGIVEVMSYPELGTPINQLKAHMSSACCIAVDSTGQHFATGGTDALVSLWDAESFCCLNSFAKLDSPVKSLGFDHCGKYLAYTSEDCVLSFVEVATGALVHEEVTKSPLQHLAWSPTRPAIAYVGDVEKGKEVLSIYKLEAS